MLIDPNGALKNAFSRVSRVYSKICKHRAHIPPIILRNFVWTSVTEEKREELISIVLIVELISRELCALMDLLLNDSGYGLTGSLT